MGGIGIEGVAVVGGSEERSSGGGHWAVYWFGGNC